MKTPVLETDRLILRPISLDDAPAIQKHFNNWEIIKYLSKQVPWPYPDDGAEIFIREKALPRMEAGEAYIWAIILKNNADEPIGMIDFTFESKGQSDRGFWLAEPHHKRGLMTEAVSAVNDHVFFECGVKKIVVTNALGNEGSRRVKEKTGAKFLKIVELEHNNGQIKSELWEVTREAWEKIRGTEKMNTPV